MGERLMYLPSVGFAGCAAYAIYAAYDRFSAAQRRAGVTALALMLMLMAARTYARNADWLDPGQFWQSGVEAAPNSFKTNLYAAHNTYLSPTHDWRRTIAEVDRSLAILDALPDLENGGVAYRDAGVMYRSLGENLASAGNAFSGTTPEYWYRKSLSALLRSEKIDLAQDRTIRLANEKRGLPGLTSLSSALYLHLGLTYQRLGDPQRALAAFEKGSTLDVNAALLKHLADAYQDAGDPHQAAIALVEALAIDSSPDALTGKLVELYSKIDPQGCSVTRQGSQTGLNLNCPLVHSDICAASRNAMVSFAHTGQKFDAASIRKTAVEDFGCAADLLK
jgi:tetratricopeptide (TPR) repeat protein